MPRNIGFARNERIALSGKTSEDMENKCQMQERKQIRIQGNPRSMLSSHPTSDEMKLRNMREGLDSKTKTNDFCPLHELQEENRNQPLMISSLSSFFWLFVISRGVKTAMMKRSDLV